jgi:hypothetical protein
MVATIISIVLSYKKNSRSLAAWPIGAFLLILALLFVGMPVALNIINAFSPARSTQIQITTIEAPRRQDPFFADIYKALPDLDPSYSLEKFSVPSGSEIIYVKSFIEGSEVSLGHVYGFNLRTKTISNMPVLNQYLMSWADAWYKTLSSDGLKYVSIEHRDPNSQTAPLYNKIFLVNLRTDSVKTLYTLTPGQTFNGLGVNSPYGDYNCPIPQWRKDNHTIFYTVYKDSGVPTSDCRPILGKGELVVP